jgi:predicted transcriptional regulator of viral defense system
VAGVNQIEALTRLKTFGATGFETRDAAALLGVSAANANMILRRLARHGLIMHVSRGRWMGTAEIDRFVLPEIITAPSPAYVSMQSALFHHGLIEQVPAVIFAVTLSRPRRVRTPLGVVSLHRLPPTLFEGFELDDKTGAKIARPEKALFDLLYLAPGRSRLFAALPELEVPRKFDWSELTRYAELVRSPARRSFLLVRIAELRTPRRVPRQ